MVTRTITLSASPITHTIPGETSRDIDYIVSGTHAMAGAIVIAVSGALTNKKFTFYYSATLTNYSTGANYLQFPGGDKLPAEFAAKKCVIECIYNGSAWKTTIVPDFNETGIITSGNILDGTIVAGDLASDSVITAKILAENVTNAKLAQMANNTIKGNDSGGSAVPQDLSVTEVRTLLDQDVTLTGNVTGTATETFATGVTTVATTIASNVITVAMLTNTVKTDQLYAFISLETAGLGYTAIKAPFDCTVEEWGVSVVSDVAGTDDATLTLYDQAGVLMTGSTITVTLGTGVSAAAPASSGFFNSAAITANNVISAGELITFRAQKTTAGGLLGATIKVKRT